MAFLTNSSRVFYARRTLILSGLFTLVLLIMYKSSSSSTEGNVARAVDEEEQQRPSHWFSNSDNDQQSFPDKWPEELQLNTKESSAFSRFTPNTRNERETPVNDTSVNNSQGNLDDNILEAGEASPLPPKKILIWNSYWQSKALWHKIFSEIIYKKCPQSNCQLTVDHDQVEQSDAVLFHLVDIPSENYKFPENRDPNQIWIAMTYEPPYILQHAKVDFQRLNGLFNRTMSYRTDGDIVVRHGTYSRMTTSSQLSVPTYISNWVNSHDSIKTRNYAEGKRRLVAWFASSRNCQSQSGRENYIKELQNYIQVDIYGSCGPYKCGVQKTMRNPYKVEEDDCYKLVSIGYKFVLAFENSLCEDYVTEKLYNHLKLNVVPVVLGASNYSMFAPPHSVIEASQYSPEDLAQYLQYLDKNDTAYNEYFRWKRDYIVEAHDGVPLACDLCEQLHNPNWQVERKVYEQFDKWITSGCRKGYVDSSLSL